MITTRNYETLIFVFLYYILFLAYIKRAILSTFPRFTPGIRLSLLTDCAFPVFLLTSCPFLEMRKHNYHSVLYHIITFCIQVI